MSTATASPLREYMDAFNTLPPECLIGHQIWYSVADAAYDPQVIENLFIQLGLNPSFLPNEIRPDDAFEKASKEVGGYRYDMGGGLTAEILVREIPRSAHTIIRKIIREVKDAKNKKLKHEELGEFVFYRPTVVNGKIDLSTARVRSTLTVDPSSPERPHLEAVVARFDELYARHTKYLDGQRIRKIAREYLLHLNAILLRPTGGIYFVLSSRRDELERLTQFFNQINPGHTNMVAIPMADLSVVREEVSAAYEREAEKDFTELITEAKRLQETRRTGVTKESCEKLRARYGEIIAKAGEHARELRISQDRTATAAEMALEVLMDLELEAAKKEASR